MQILQNVNIDWLGKTKIFLAISVILLVMSGVALYQDGGPLLGVDFRGGTVVYVGFAERPPIDQIRSGLAAQGLGASTIQRLTDVTNPDANEVVITIDQTGDESESLDRGKQLILQALNNTFGSAAQPGKQDINAATPAALGDFLALRDPLTLGPASAGQYAEMGRAIAAFRDEERSGLLKNFDELAQVPGVTPAVVSALGSGFYPGIFVVRNVEIVGPRVGAQLQRQAVLATVYALIGMLIYVAFRFEWVYGAAAVLAVVHDVLITLGFFALFDYEISLTVIAALLTLVGYSMNDTIVIFDRMRENLRTMRREPLLVVANKSINQTLARTVLTSGLTFLTVLILFLLGGEVLRSFSFALVMGIMVGTYSSIGIAAALVVAWDKWQHPRRPGQKVEAGPAARDRQEESTRQLAAAGRR